jgi:hypothetical protein
LVLLTIKICTFGLNILEHLRKISTKIAFILITTLILACNAEKRVPDGKQLS